MNTTDVVVHVVLTFMICILFMPMTEVYLNDHHHLMMMIIYYDDAMLTGFFVG